MCPACLSTLVLLAAGAGSAGGVTALVVKKLRGKKAANTPEPKTRAGAPERKDDPDEA